MQLITIIVTISIITQNSTVRKTKRLPLLLTDTYASNKVCSTITFFEFRRISICFNCSTEFFITNKIQILNIVSIKCSALSTRRGFGDCRYTIPSTSVVVNTSGLSIENYVLNTSLIETFRSLVPYNLILTHNFISFLPINIKYPMIQIVSWIKSNKTSIFETV